MPNGDLLPCRRMPVLAGNLFETPLVELYRNNSFLNELRDRNKISKGCGSCFYESFCKGGLKCLSYSINGNPFTADPGCWIKKI